MTALKGEVAGENSIAVTGTAIGKSSLGVLGRELLQALPPPIVTISPVSRVTAQDIAQFDARWMSAADLEQRLADHKYGLKNRQVMFAWGVFDDASAMVRMFELTHQRKYLDHLQKVNNLAFDFRDDQHKGDDFPPTPEFPRGNNPICLNCRPSFVDGVRGKVVPAWGSGIYSDYVVYGGLNPVDSVISGMYVYGLAAFARLVAEDPDPQLRAAYHDDAMKFANATMETMWAFMPDWDTRQAGNHVEGTFVLPHRIPTASQCLEARDLAIEHVRQFDPELSPEHFEAFLKDMNDAKGEGARLRDYAGKPLAHNMSMALVMSFIELWRALDSHFYRTSPHRAGNAELTRGVIPLVVTRHQRYFFNRLRPKGNFSRYEWNYGDDVPNPAVEDTSHGNLDMFYIDILWRSFDRLNAQVAPMGEPIPLHDRMLRAFANTFLHIARPAEIDGGGNVRGRVNGDATKPNKEGKTDGNNHVLNGWVTLAAVDPTVYRLCRDVLLRTGTREGQPVQNYLYVANHAALLANKGANVPSIPLMLQPGVYTIQQQSNGRFVDAHEIEAKDFALVTRAAQNNDTQRWILTPVGGVYTIQQKSNGRFVDAHEIEGKNFALVTRTAQNDDTQRWVLTRLGGPYTIQQRSNGRYVDAHNSEENDFALVTRTAQNSDNQRWTVTPSGNNTYTIQQRSNDRYVDAHEIEEKDFALVTRTAQDNDTQRWVLTPVGVLCTIQQESNGRYVDAHDSAENDFALVTRTAHNNDNQRWVLTPSGNNTYTIQQKSNGRYVDAHEIEGKDFALVTRTAQNNDSQRWLIKIV